MQRLRTMLVAAIAVIAIAVRIAVRIAVEELVTGILDILRCSVQLNHVSIAANDPIFIGEDESTILHDF